jgi:hypothetical protein
VIEYAQSDVEAGVSPAMFSECGRHGRHYSAALIATILVLLASLSDARAQGSPTASPFSPAVPIRNIRISFAPPPIVGTISLGVYDRNGKLVRVLHRESETDDFTLGHDALITEWDGKNDAGDDLPAGKYHARGFTVGPLSIEGVAYFFNDWVTDEKSPHIKRIHNLALNGTDLRLKAELASGELIAAVYDLTNHTMSQTEIDQGPGSGQGTTEILKSEGVVDPVGVTSGKAATTWVIDRLQKGSAEVEVKQVSTKGEILRRLSYQPNDPAPRAITASREEDKIFVLEETLELQRVRSLTLVATTMDSEKQQPVSDWKVDFEKTILAHKDFSLDGGKPIATPGKATPEKITQKLQPNPLKRDKPGSVDLAIGLDSDGSYLKTSDGLPLRTISDTPHLSRALLTPSGENAIDVFQDDGAVVEQFRISGAHQMMAFDCGDFELK